MKNTLNFLSVRQGDKYGPEYTEALKKQAPGLIVLGDDRPLQTDLKGWLAKFEVFAPWNRDLRPCLFIDLDTYIPGDLNPFNDLNHSHLWLIDDFNVPKRGETGLFIAPKDGISSELWLNHPQHGTDGEYIRQFEHKRLNPVVSGIKSYKKHCKDGPSGRIICFHGQPKPHNAKGWAKAYWNSLISKTMN